MPQKIICGDCGEVFYNKNDLKSPEDVLQQYDGVCPNCGKELSFDPSKIDIFALQDEKKVG